MPQKAVDSAVRRLRRHDLLRALGQPVVTVLAGGPKETKSVLAQWLSAIPRPVLQGLHGERTELFAVLDTDSVASDVLLEILAESAGESPEAIYDRMRTGTASDRALLAGHIPACSARADHLLRAFVCAGGSLHPDMLLPHANLPATPLECLMLLAEVLPQTLLPVVCLRSPAAEAPAAVHWLLEQAQRLDRAIQVAPGLCFVLCVEPKLWQDYLDQAPESRAKTLCRQGLVALDWKPAGRVGPRGSAGAKSVVLALPDSPARRRAEAALVQANALRRIAKNAPPAEQDAARSAQEAFLYAVLEAHPETGGYFRLNQQLSVDEGRTLEIDLLSREWRIALEVDGYYHFKEPAAFRRDRRKDYRLQRAGYLVLRVLAEDVAPRLEEVLDFILTAVHHRQGERKRV